MILLHTAVAGQENSWREKATWRWLGKAERSFFRSSISVRHVTIDPHDDLAYCWNVRRAWVDARSAKTGLTTFERDMLPTPVQFAELVDCEEEVCAIDYPLFRCYGVEVVSFSGSDLSMPDGSGYSGSHLIVCTDHLPPNLSMMKNELRPEDPDGPVEWNPGWWDHCNCPPLGLTKFSAAVIARIAPTWPDCHWLQLDTAVGNLLARNRVRTHIHLPMAEHRRSAPVGGCVYPPSLLAKFPGVHVTRVEQVRPELRLQILAVHRAFPTHSEFPKVEVP